MKIVIAHFHLNRGGVSQVIHNHLHAINLFADSLKVDKVVLCHGGRASGWPSDLAKQLKGFELAECHVAGLDYDEDGAALNDRNRVTDNFLCAIRKHGCTVGDSILHFHNHSLGKNVVWPAMVCTLGRMGFHLLLQIHDFAEDYRPRNYRRLVAMIDPNAENKLAWELYPQAAHIHYCVINGRDYGVLKEAGVAADRLHLIPNSVLAPPTCVSRMDARARAERFLGISSANKYVLYPVRGIRRKNLGEFLLWASVAPPCAFFGTTLPPVNPDELSRYERWRKLARELKLPVRFEVGSQDGLPLALNFAACDRVITTSLAEGFGLAFLESCIWRRLVIGRDLPEITSDFYEHGLSFSGLRSSVRIPVVWIGKLRLRNSIASKYNATLASFGLTPKPPTDLIHAIEEKLENNLADFGDLNANQQEQVIRRACASTKQRERLVQLNAWIHDVISGDESALVAETDRNANIVESEYSIQAIGAELSRTYRNLISSPQSESLSPLVSAQQILTAFLSVNRFRSVRI